VPFRHLLVYNASHFLQLIGLLLYVYATLDGFGGAVLPWHLVVSASVLALLEVARKMRTREEDAAGDTYSFLLGSKGATTAYLVIGSTAAIAATGVVAGIGGPPSIDALPALALGVAAAAGVRYAHVQDARSADAVQRAGVLMFVAAHAAVILGALL
jgi:hypothetical protein